MHSHNFPDDPKNEPDFLESLDAVTKVMSNNPGSAVLMDTTSDSMTVTQQVTYHNSNHSALAL